MAGRSRGAFRVLGVGVEKAGGSIARGWGAVAVRSASPPQDGPPAPGRMSWTTKREQRQELGSVPASVEACAIASSVSAVDCFALAAASRNETLFAASRASVAPIFTC